MTDKERAEEYRKDLKSKFFLSELQLDLACQGFKDGYNKANEWHDLRKNPNNLPEPYSTVLDENGDRITYLGGDMWTVYSGYYEEDIDAKPPKAWCEIPNFNLE